jgi:hypothetical protein
MQKPIAFHWEGEEDLSRGFGYISFLAVGGISFLVLEHYFSEYIEVLLGEHTQKGFFKLWPRASRNLPWPPELMMDVELIEPLFLLPSQPPSFDIRVFPGSRLHESPFAEVGS